MEALKAEILKKKRLLEEKLNLEPSKKYFKRGELLEKLDADLREKYAVASTEEAPQVVTSNAVDIATQSEHATLSRREVVRRLRDRSQPILLFGETVVEAFQRLRRVEILEPEVNKGFRNDFQEALEKVDQAFLDEVASSQSGAALDVTVADDGVTYEEILSRAQDLGKGDRELDAQLTHKFFQLILKLWGRQLNERPSEEKRSTRGKLASATWTQTQNYLKPLFRKLKTYSLPNDILDSLTEILVYLLDRNYIKANDSYLQMAIGNAPWPIGVTMVGIHARTGREKIFSKNVAHVLNDETQRKYIQALKRLMTKCQHFFPTDPSRCVEYQGPEKS